MLNVIALLLTLMLLFQVVDILKLAMAQESSAGGASTSGQAMEAGRMLNAVLASLASDPGTWACAFVCVCSCMTVLHASMQ